MSATSKTIYYFSFYLLVAGATLFFFPNRVLPLLGLAPTPDVWIHLVGALTFILGVFFCYMARKDSRAFSFISMFGRGIFTAAILGLVLFHGAPDALLLFAAADVIGLVWTLWAYRCR